SALGNLSGLLRGAGRAIINGLINGIKSMFGGVKGALGDLTGKLTSWKGPPKRDKVLLKPAAALIMNGFIDQINDKRRELRRTLQNVTKDVAAMGGTTPELGGNFAVYGHGTHAGGVTNVTNVNVTLEAPVGASAVEIGRELSTYLKAYERAGGR
ncbi:hypothetical protein, partial [Mycolicibacterium sp.]|uniref:hypothetical protein n=1 Tax=Mycolicibacterium sp. TaxID=2320850 RepID=UPI0035603377